MKKILTAIALIACLVLPLSAMSMTAIGDNEMSAITGQAGVSIGADLTTNLTFDTVAWGDSDGIASSANAGWVGLKDGNINTLRMHMRTDSGMIDPVVAYGIYLTTFAGTGAADQAAFNVLLGTGDVLATKAALFSVLTTNQLLRIDVYSNAGKSYVRIGLPTFEVNMASMTATAGLWTDATNDATFQEMGKLYVSNMVMLLGKNNYVDISQNNTASGILINMGNTAGGNLVDSLTISALSWGDSDGLAAFGAAGAGYVGLQNLAVTGVKAAATMNINVGTATGLGITPLLTTLAGITDLATLASFKAGLIAQLDANVASVKDSLAYLLYTTGAISKTSVDIALVGSVSIASITATASTGSSANLATDTGVLGTLYVKNLSAVIPAYAGAGTAASWVSISAH